MLHDVWISLVSACAGNAQVALAAGMGGAKNPAVPMYDILQNSHRKTAAFHQEEFHVLGQNHKDMAGVYRIVFDTFQNNKIFQFIF